MSRGHIRIAWSIISVPNGNVEYHKYEVAQAIRLISRTSPPEPRPGNMSYPTLIHGPGQRSSSAALMIDRHPPAEPSASDPSGLRVPAALLAPSSNGTPSLFFVCRASTSMSFPRGETRTSRHRTPHVRHPRHPRASNADSRRDRQGPQVCERQNATPSPPAAAIPLSPPPPRIPIRAMSPQRWTGATGGYAWGLGFPRTRGASA